MDTLGSTTKNVFYKGVEAHKLHHAFPVADRRIFITYSADFVASNSIAVTIDGVAITPEVYATSHAATFAALVTAIDGLSTVESATGNATTRVITIIPVEQDVDVTASGAVTLGASQATTTIVTNTNDIFKGMPVMLDSDGSVKRVESSANLTCIGYAIMDGVAGDVITVALKGIAIVEALSADAIVPGPVAYSSYDTTAEKLKFTDTSVTATNIMGWAIDTADSADDAILVILIG